MVPSPPDAQPSFFSALVSDLRPRQLVIVLVLLVAASIFTRVVNLGLRRVLQRHRERGTLLPATATQLALTRRLLNFVVWFTAVALSLAQFPELRVLSTSLLASAGVSGLIVGFAARSTLGNAIAGLTISITQPIRIGDDVELGSDRGIVEDIHFTYTVLRLGDGRRLIVPNDTLAREVVKNATLGGVTRVARAEVLVPPAGAAETVRAALLEVANGYEQLDRTAAEPDVQFVRVDERGTLLRLIATCTDTKAAERLVQKALGRAAAVVFQRAL